MIINFVRKNWKKVAAFAVVVALAVTIWQIIEVRKTWIEIEVASVETIEGNPGMVEKTYINPKNGDSVTYTLENTGDVWDEGYTFKVSPERYREMFEDAGVN